MNEGYEGVEGFVEELGATVRECIDCGCLTPGGLTRCKACAAKASTPYDEPPATMQVGPFTYQVTHEDVEHFRDDGRDLIGQVDYLSLTMRIAAKNAPAVRFAALWHETLHAVSELFGLDLSEGQVDGLSHGIVMVLRDNPHLRAVGE